MVSKSRHQDDSIHCHLEKCAQGQKKEGGVESISEGVGADLPGNSSLTDHL